MKIIIWVLIAFFLTSCTSYKNYEDFQERKDVTKITFQDNMKKCKKLGHLQTARSERSRRAGEVLIDKKRYFMSCMNRKGWIAKASN